MPAANPQSWTVTQATPLGDVRTSWELTPEGLRLRSDAPMGADSQPLRWDAIAEAATAVVDLPAPKGGPDMVSWMPSRMEWLLRARIAREGHRAARADGQRRSGRPAAGREG